MRLLTAAWENSGYPRINSPRPTRTRRAPQKGKSAPSAPKKGPKKHPPRQKRKRSVGAFNQAEHSSTRPDDFQFYDEEDAPRRSKPRIASEDDSLHEWLTEPSH